jgi:hypothetical protein
MEIATKHSGGDGEVIDGKHQAAAVLKVCARDAPDHGAADAHHRKGIALQRELERR